MSLTILIIISLLFAGNYFLLAHEYLKVPRPRVAATEFSNLDTTTRTDGFLLYLRELQILEHDRKSRLSEKVNWKEEGF